MRNNHLTLIISLLLALITFITFWQVQNNDFVDFDDDVYITQNCHVQDGLTLKSIIWAFTSKHASNWHPLTWLSHMLDWELYGSNPKGHHLNNLLFHIINTLLLFLVLKQLTGAIWRSCFVAALFALHPLHVESVAWVAERKDVLSTFFGMLTIWAYIRYVKHQSLNRYLLTLLFLAMGLMAKPMLVTLPCILLLLDYWPLRRFQSRKSDHENKNKTKDSIDPCFRKLPPLHLVLEKIPLFFFAVASSISTLVAAQHEGAIKSLEMFPLKTRLANAIVSYAGYVTKMVWPQNLAVFYPHPGNMLPMGHVTAAGLLLLSVSLIILSPVI